MCNYATRFVLPEILLIFQKELLYHIYLLAINGSIHHSASNNNMEMNYDHVTPPLFEKEESTKMVITLTDDNISTDYLKEELTKQRHEILSILETKYTIILKCARSVMLHD